MNLFNNNFCHSVKNKNNIELQCNNKCKENEILCGVHLNCKNVILYHNVDENKENKIIYSKDELFKLILNDSYINIYSIRKSIKNCSLKSIINTKQSKNILIDLIKKIIDKEQYYISNIHSIILVQSFFRKWLVYRKKICFNDTDILTFTCKYEIPDKYFYVFRDKITNKKYGYDIRTLCQIIESEYALCPYTFRSFTEDEKNEITLYKNKLYKYGINIDIVKNILTYEEQTEMKIKDVFYEINMLDNYTNPNWFKNLDYYQLIELYIKTEDIWNYRSNMDIESKKRIVNDGKVFNIPIYIIKKIKSTITLQNIILDDYLKLITEGINREEKKLGAILILTGLVEISIDAADALPHLIQI